MSTLMRLHVAQTEKIERLSKELKAQISLKRRAEVELKFHKVLHEKYKSEQA
jgi:hypothetical protein